MLIQKDWLKDYIEIDISDEKIAEVLSLSGSSVDEIIKRIDNKVIVVEIVKIEPHPNADRLRLATVFDGANEIKVVCGAPNIEIGQRVPLAQLGAKLPGGIIEKSNIRGIDSFGMLCAADELGLGDDHSGILVFEKDQPLSKPVNEIVSAQTIFDLEITPNRGDCLSYLGVARELSVLTSKNLKDLGNRPIESGAKLKIEIKDFDQCFQYHGALIKNVTIKESPDWLKQRLIDNGLKSINNIVDITNYIMLDLGQPLHAFDFAKLDGAICVRQAEKNEKIICLDGLERTLDSTDLVIADAKGAIALAGVMGGANSQIDEKTVDIIIEGAEFNPKTIRKTVKLQNLASEASYRFERGVDSGRVKFAVEKAAHMVVEMAGGKIFGLSSCGVPQENTNILIDYNKIRQLIGQNYDDEVINTILTKLGFIVENHMALPPSWRHDVSCWQDLAEEVARVSGYENIPRKPMEKSAKAIRSSYFGKEFIKDKLVDNGFNEIFSYPFLSEKDLEIAKIVNQNLIEVANPIQPENKYLRPTLTVSLLKAIAKNPSFDPVALFELGHVFIDGKEKIYLGLVIAGKNAKKILQKTLDEIGAVAEIKEMTNIDLQRFKIRKPITCVAEIDVDKISNDDLQVQSHPLQAPEKKVLYRSVSKYPPVARDISFLVDVETSNSEIQEIIFNECENILLVELFDEFTSEKLGQNKKSIAFHLYFQDMTKALTDSEVELMTKKIINVLEKKFQAQLR